MQIIEITALENGAHRNQTWSGPVSSIPAGYAVIPDGIVIPDSFPFVDIEIGEDGRIIGLTARDMPEPEPVPEPAPTEEEQLRADVDFLLAMGGYVG